MGRTTSPIGYVYVQYLILIYLLVGGLVDLSAGRTMHAVCSLLNFSFFLYVVLKFIGLRESYEDILVTRKAKLPMTSSVPSGNDIFPVPILGNVEK